MTDCNTGLLVDLDCPIDNPVSVPLNLMVPRPPVADEDTDPFSFSQLQLMSARRVSLDSAEPSTKQQEGHSELRSGLDIEMYVGEMLEKELHRELERSYHDNKSSLDSVHKVHNPDSKNKTEREEVSNEVTDGVRQNGSERDVILIHIDDDRIEENDKQETFRGAAENNNAMKGQYGITHSSKVGSENSLNKVQLVHIDDDSQMDNCSKATSAYISDTTLNRAAVISTANGSCVSNVSSLDSQNIKSRNIFKNSMVLGTGGALALEGLLMREEKGIMDENLELVVSPCQNFKDLQVTRLLPKGQTSYSHDSVFYSPDDKSTGSPTQFTNFIEKEYNEKFLQEALNIAQEFTHLAEFSPSNDLISSPLVEWSPSKSPSKPKRQGTYILETSLLNSNSFAEQNEGEVAAAPMPIQHQEKQEKNVVEESLIAKPITAKEKFVKQSTSSSNEDDHVKAREGKTQVSAGDRKGRMKRIGQPRMVMPVTRKNLAALGSEANAKGYSSAPGCGSNSSLSSISSRDSACASVSRVNSSRTSTRTSQDNSMPAPNTSKPWTKLGSGGVKPNTSAQSLSETRPMPATSRPSRSLAKPGLKPVGQKLVLKKGKPGLVKAVVPAQNMVQQNSSEPGEISSVNSTPPMKEKRCISSLITPSGIKQFSILPTASSTPATTSRATPKLKGTTATHRANTSRRSASVGPSTRQNCASLAVSGFMKPSATSTPSQADASVTDSSNTGRRMVTGTPQMLNRRQSAVPTPTRSFQSSLQSSRISKISSNSTGSSQHRNLSQSQFSTMPEVKRKGVASWGSGKQSLLHQNRSSNSLQLNSTGSSRSSQDSSPLKYSSGSNKFEETRPGAGTTKTVRIRQSGFGFTARNKENVRP